MIKKFYNNFRDLLPGKYQRILSRAVLKTLNKPFYYADGFLPLKKGALIISADFELAWAWRFSKRNINPLEMGRWERENFPFILNKLNELKIPVTWATIGHLFLDQCIKKNGMAHSDLKRPPYFENEFWKFSSGDWYDIDPCSNYKNAPEFYAPDLIETLLKSPVNHEIGCHSFSHCDFSEKNSSPELIEDELLACKNAMNKFGVDPVSFVFPGNRHGHFDLLKKHGYKAVRYKTNEFKEIGYPEKLNNGLIAIHDSLAFDQKEDGWDYNFLIWKFKRYIQKAIDKKAICHFWFHPSLSRKDVNGIFFPILEYAAEKRESGELDIVTMSHFIN